MSAAEAATAMLDVEQIEVAYGKARAVNGATLRVAEGSITAIVGPNGAGKTSLVKAVSGLQPIRAGTIRFDRIRINVRVFTASGRQDRKMWASI
ncbi:MAG TPA: ATP-binding cassette domain-containing protein [Methylomirabilota bacterium]|nr:ATP-binding cassette domain-containing protein [Methylomirabilota bacterium]